MFSDVEPRFWTVSETAVYLGVSDSLVRRLVDQGEIGAIKVGTRAVRVDRDALADFVASRSYTKVTRWKGLRRRLGHAVGYAGRR